MEGKKSDRYEKWKKLKERKKGLTAIREAADTDTINKFLTSDLDLERVNHISGAIESRNSLKEAKEITNDEVRQLVSSINKEFDQYRFKQLIDECKETTVRQVVTTFGLGHFVSSSKLIGDKDGGNVTTKFNFEKGITSTAEDQHRYEGYTDEYDRSEYEKNFSKIRKKEFQDNGTIINAYNGKELKKDGTTHLDHVVSAHEIDADSKNHLFMTDKERLEMSQDKTNLKMTDSSLNQSKADEPLSEWMEKEKARKVILEDGTSEWKSVKNKDYFDVDEEMALDVDKTARKTIKKKQTQAQIKKQGSELAKTGAKEGLKMGLQQSVGMLIGEFAAAVFDEIGDIFKSGFKNGQVDKSFFEALKIRLERISKRVLAKWKDVVAAFKEGAISGFFSNLITFVINCFITTSARMVRIVREGFFSLVRAFKLMMNPPEGMTKKQVAHEVTKLVAAALVTTGGILIEDSVEKFLTTIPVINAFAGFASVAIVGLATGLLTTFVVYGIDRLDLFGVVAAERSEFLSEKLDCMMDESLKNVEEIVCKDPVIISWCELEPIVGI